MFLCSGSLWATEKQVASPDGKMTVTVSDEGGKPVYQITRSDVVFVEKSPLGLKLNIEDLTQGLALKDCKIQTVKDEYTLNTIKQRHVSYEATEAVCQFEKDGRVALDIIFRVSNRDVAYRYKLYPKKVRGGETLVAVVESEASGFVLPEGTTTFLCPQSKPMGGFARTSPSYETSYTLDDQMGKNGWGEGYTFPCLFKAPGGWVLISETGTDGGYVGCRLLNDGGANYRIGFPQQGEMNGIGSVTPGVALPSVTPWRTITLGEDLKNIVETTVANDLVEPKYKASASILMVKVCGRGLSVWTPAVISMNRSVMWTLLLLWVTVHCLSMHFGTSRLVMKRWRNSRAMPSRRVWACSCGITPMALGTMHLSRRRGRWISLVLVARRWLGCRRMVFLVSRWTSSVVTNNR